MTAIPAGRQVGGQGWFGSRDAFDVSLDIAGGAEHSGVIIWIKEQRRGVSIAHERKAV